MSLHERRVKNYEPGSNTLWSKDAVIYQLHIKSFPDADGDGILLNWIRQMLALRRRHGAFARGAMRFAKTDDDRVIAYLRTCGDDVILCAANLSSVSLHDVSSDWKGQLSADVPALCVLLAEADQGRLVLGELRRAGLCAISLCFGKLRPRNRRHVETIRQRRFAATRRTRPPLAGRANDQAWGPRR